MLLFFRLLDFILLPFSLQSFKPPLGNRLLSYPLLVNNLKQTWLWELSFINSFTPEMVISSQRKQMKEGNGIEQVWSWTRQNCKAWRLTLSRKKQGELLKLVSNAFFTRKLGKTKNEISEWHVDPIPYNTQIDSFKYKSSCFTVLGSSLAEKKLYEAKFARSSSE